MKTEMQPKHTKGEWKKRIAAQIIVENMERDFRRDIIVDRIGVVAISVGHSLEEAEANAQQIVKAVNMHDQLVDALKLIIESCNPTNVISHYQQKGLDLGEYYVGGCGIPSNKAIHLAVNAIAKVEGK